MEKIVKAYTSSGLLASLKCRLARLDKAALQMYQLELQDCPDREFYDRAITALIDAIAGVNVATDAVRRKLGISCDAIAEAEDAKIAGWERGIYDEA